MIHLTKELKLAFEVYDNINHVLTSEIHKAQRDLEKTEDEKLKTELKFYIGAYRHCISAATKEFERVRDKSGGLVE